VVGRDLLAQLGDALLQLLGTDHHLPEMRVLHRLPCPPRPVSSSLTLLKLAVSPRVQHAGTALHPPPAGEVDRPPFTARDGEDGVDLVERRRGRTQPAPD